MKRLRSAKQPVSTTFGSVLEGSLLETGILVAVSLLLLVAGIGAVGRSVDISRARSVGSLGYRSLADAFDNVGTSNNDGTSGDFDGAGHSYSRQDLAAQGWTPGKLITYASVALRWPTAKPGQPDNVTSNGQVISLHGQGTALTFLGAASGDDASGTVKITYADGSVRRASITMPGWTEGNPALNIISLLHQNTTAGQRNQVAQIFPITIPLDSSKPLTSVTLPVITGPSEMHFFAMAVRTTMQDWTASWGASSQGVQTVGPWQDQTVRITVRSSLGGSRVRLRFTNSYNEVPTTIGHVTLALQLNGAIAKDAPVTVTFGGKNRVIMPAGTDITSDPIAMDIPANTRLLISEYLPGTVARASVHNNGHETNYLSAAGTGDHTGDVDDFPVTQSFAVDPFIVGVDVESSAGAVVAFGDSIAEGTGTAIDTDASWPSVLADRVASRRGVVNAGISGNRITADLLSMHGASAINREYRDVIAISGVRDVIILEGINDIRDGASAATIEAGLKQLVTLVQQYGIKAYLATLLPFGGSTDATAAAEASRQAVNAWIRSGKSGADAVFDFDRAVTNGGDPETYKPIYDFDHLHPSVAGHAAIANAIDLSLL